MHRAWAAGDAKAIKATLDIAGQVLLTEAYRPPLPPEAVVPCESTHSAHGTACEQQRPPKHFELARLLMMARCAQSFVHTLNMHGGCGQSAGKMSNR